MNYTIISCSPKEIVKSDISTIINICNGDFPYSLGNPNTNRDQVIKKLYENAYWILAYSENNDLLGFITYYLNTDNLYCYIPYFWVNARFRRLNIGSQMLQKSRLLLSEINYELRLEVRKDNVGAIKFYLKNGFVISEDRIEKYMLVYKM